MGRKVGVKAVVARRLGVAIGYHAVERLHLVGGGAQEIGVDQGFLQGAGLCLALVIARRGRCVPQG